MNANQLHSARLARWSQDGEARLTVDSALEWLKSIGLCLWLPGESHAGPAPSFLEAVVGRPAPVPSAGEIARAGNLLTPMIENAVAAPLKFGVQSGEDSERIASPEALRYIYALRGDRNFKSGPSTTGNASVTPLALHCFEVIRDQGPLTAAVLRTVLGGDITEAALARALNELWFGLYVFPIWTGDPRTTTWDSLSRRFPEPVAAGACTSHVEAQSALVSLYLHSVVAAAEEEILTFLDPLAPQSKLREMIRDLGSMRQLEMVDIGGRVHLCLPGEQLPRDAVRAFEDSQATTLLPAEEDVAAKTPAATRPASQPGRRPPADKFAQSRPKKFDRGFAAEGSRPRKFSSSRFDRRDSRKPFRSTESSGPGFSDAPRDRGKPSRNTGGKPWMKTGGKPWMKRSADGPRSGRSDWNRGDWNRGDRNQRGPDSREPDSRGPDSRSRDSHRRDERDGDRRRENRPANDRHSGGRSEWNPRPRRWERPQENAEPAGSSDAPGSREQRPWAKKKQRPAAGGTRPKKFSSRGAEVHSEGQGKQPFWAGKPRRGKGPAGKHGPKRGSGAPRGKKK